MGTYWLAFPLLGMWTIAVVAILIGYYRKVIVPSREWQIWQARQRRRAQLALVKNRPTRARGEDDQWHMPETRTA
ncbi:MAG: hypothetical protein QOG87_2183 [Actinomycetota bacterium]|jgi:hypothetical protein